MAIQHCKQCNIEFKAPPSVGRKFCGRSCATTYRNLTDNPMNNKKSLEKMRQSQMGKVPWQRVLGDKHPKVIEYKKKMGINLKLNRKNNIVKTWNKGLKFGDHPSIEKYGRKIRGKNNGMWRGGKYLRLYRGTCWDRIRKKILERDNYTCQKCEKIFNENNCKKLVVHHIIPYRYKKDNSTNNLVSLCNVCHNKVEHRWKSHLDILKNKMEVRR